MYEFYQKVLDHLRATGQGFVFTEYGIISWEDCQDFILNYEMPTLNRIARSK